MVLLLPQQLQDEVPQLDLPGPGARLGLVGPVWEGETWVGEAEREGEKEGLAWRPEQLGEPITL